MIYLLAGHTPKGIRQDPGAVANGVREADLTLQLRDATADILRNKGLSVYEDDDQLRLAEVLMAVKSTDKDVVCDIHFNAGPEAATGVEVLIPARHTTEEENLAILICSTFSSIMKIKNRGMKTESEGQHKSLGVMRELGINLLVEVCFITNKKDLAAYQGNVQPLANALATILETAEKVI